MVSARILWCGSVKALWSEVEVSGLVKEFLLRPGITFRRGWVEAGEVLEDV